MNQIFQQPFVQITLPILIGFVSIGIWQNRRIDDLRSDMNGRFADMRGHFAEINRRIDEIIQRLDRIERKLDDHEQRLVRLEERTSPLGKRG
jgi:predicted nuclease with TOPRIM domain